MIIDNLNTNYNTAKKICFITIDISLKGGIERVICNLSNQFVGDYAVEIISLFRSNPKIQYDINPEVVLTYLSDYKFGYRSYKLLLFKTLLQKRSYFTKNTTTKYIGLYPIINIFLIFFLRFRDDSLIAAEHSEYFSQSWLLRKFRAISYKRINKIVVLTQSGKDCFEKIGIPVRVIPNAVTDFENILQWSSKDMGYQSLQCLFAGRFEPVKQVDHIIELAKTFSKDDIKNVHFNFLGEGPLFLSMVKLADREKLTNLTFWGSVENIDKHYLENQILLISSKTEAFPMVVIEAMSFGCVVIGYDSQAGTKEIIKDGVNGFIVAHNNVKALSEKVRYLVNNPNRLIELSYSALISAKSFKDDIVRKSWIELLN